MFYYRVTVRAEGRGLLGNPTYHEFLRPSDLGEYVGGRFADGAAEVRVRKIRQADFVRFTRAGE